MIDSLKEIPIIFSVLYESAPELSLNNCKRGLINTISTVAKGILSVGVYLAITSQSPYFIGICFTLGLAFPDFFMEKTSRIYAAIFHTKELQRPDMKEVEKLISTIWYSVKKNFNRLKPIIATSLVAFFALPCATGSIIAVVASLRIGAYFGKLADLNTVNTQPFYA